MPNKYTFTHEQVEELELSRKKNKNKNVDKRVRALLYYNQGMNRKAIAEKTGFAATYITELVGKYRKGGIDAIAGNHYKGNRRNLTFEQEAALIEPFRKKSAAGQVTSIRELKKAYEEATGKSLQNNNKGQIYRVLARHNGRKVMPRSVHPKKASPEDIEASKKLTTLSKK
jgi:transposase